MSKGKKAQCDRCLATCQMNVLSVVLMGGGMGLDQAIRQLGLDKEKYARLAMKEGLAPVAKAIRKINRER
jgi:hypothetical protein